MSTESAENAPDARYSVHSLELGLRILESFDRDAVDEMSLSEMARRIGVSRSSAFRLVHTLQRLGYLEREDETKNYRLGARVMSLGYSFLASKDIAELALFLCSERARQIQGTAIAVDGGATVGYY